MSIGPERISLVTARYSEMQGLRHVLIGTVFGVVFGTILVTGGIEHEWGLPSALVLAFSLMVLGMRGLDRYYERVFGRVEPSAENRWFRTLSVPATLCALMWLDSLAGAPPFSLFFIGYAVFGLRIAWRDRQFRAYYSLDAIAGLLAVWVQWQAGAGRQDEGYLWGLVVIGVAAAVTGSLDHRLLATTQARPARPIR